LLTRPRRVAAPVAEPAPDPGVRRDKPIQEFLV
jgi:hypothetical protein